MVHIRQSRPDSGLGFQTKVRKKRLSSSSLSSNLLKFDQIPDYEQVIANGGDEATGAAYSSLPSNLLKSDQIPDYEQVIANGGDEDTGAAYSGSLVVYEMLEAVLQETPAPSRTDFIHIRRI